MPLDLNAYTTRKPIAAPQDRTATFYGTIVDSTGFRSLAIYQEIDAVTGSGGTMTGAVKYGSFSSLGAYDYTTTGDTWIPLRNDTNDNIKIAHAFTTAAGSTPSFYSVTFRMYEAGTVAAAKYIWATLEGTSGADPDDTPFDTSYKILATDITTSTSGELVTFYFRGGAVSGLTASTTYHCVLQGDWSVSTTNHIKVHVDTLASGGTISLFDASWAQVTTQSPYTLSSVVAAWTTISANAFTAATAVIEDVEATSVQEQIVDTTVYGPAIRYESVKSGTVSTCLCSALGILGDPKYPS